LILENAHSLRITIVVGDSSMHDKEQFQRKIQRAREVSILAIAEQLGIQIIRSHPRYTECYCPFHGGDSGVLHHDANRNFFKCYGGCTPTSTTGRPKSVYDPLALVMEVQKLDFKQALEFLLGESDERVNLIPIKRPDRPAPQPEQPIPTSDVDVLHQRLMTTPQGEIALQYLASRGIERRTALRWRLGLSDQWNEPITYLDAKVPNLTSVLQALIAKGLDLIQQHEIFRKLCWGGLSESQTIWLSRFVDLDLLKLHYGRACHMRSHRLIIPVWENGPPQEGEAICWGLRYRYIPRLTPDPPVHIGCTLIQQATHQKYTLKAILEDDQFLVQLKRDSDVPSQIASSDAFSPDISKCWGKGTVRTLAANHRQGKRFVICVEGEIDLLSLDQSLLTTPLHRNCWLISSTNGASSFPSEWQNHEFWSAFTRIYFAYDKDRAGLEALRRMRAHGMTLDDRQVPMGKDFNDWHRHCAGQIPHAVLMDWIGKHCWFASPAT
jgi:Toprim-like/CHC2 zinc finger